MKTAGFNVFWRLYVFRGSERPNGIKLCVRDKQGQCIEHGIFFGDLDVVMSQLPKIQKLPRQFAEKPIREVGSCNQVPPRVIFPRGRRF